MGRWRKQLHLAIIFILITSLLSPVTAIKAQHIDEDSLSSVTDSSNSGLDDSEGQGNTTTTYNSVNSEEQDSAPESDEEIEPENSPVQEVSPPSEAELDDSTPLDGAVISDIQLNIEEPFIVLEAGETFQLSATDSTNGNSVEVTWSSSKPEIATADSSGLVTAVTNGEADITATVNTTSVTIKVHVVPVAVKEMVDLIIALHDELKPTEEIHQQLLAIRQKESRFTSSIRNIFDTTPYQKLLRQKEVEFAINYMTDPTNATPSVEQITTLDEELSSQLEKIRNVYTSLFSYTSNRYVPTSQILEALDYELAKKEVKYAILVIDALPKIENLTVESTTKEQLDYARKKYDGIVSTFVVPGSGFPDFGIPDRKLPIKDEVTNRQDLFDKEVKYVELLIDAIDTDSLSAKEQLAAAKVAYEASKRINDGSNKALSNRVSNYNTLLDKEKILNAENDINKIIDEIAALPSVEALVWADRSQVINAQQSYDTLLDDFKVRVTNYTKLQDLQKRLVELEPSTQVAYTSVANYLSSSSVAPTYGSEWTIITLARGDNFEKYASYYEQYYSNLVNHLEKNDGRVGSQSTDWSRVIIALTAIGKDPTNVAGYNLVEKLEDLSFATSPGINSKVFSLIALDTWQFELSESATTTREKLIDAIARDEKSGGGFAFSGSVADGDMTGMALQALAPYYESNPKAKGLIDSSVQALVNIQLPNGGYKSADFGSFKGSENPESAAQAILGLSSLGIDVNKDERFNKVISNIMTYQSDDGGFKHVYSQKKADGMATVQVGYSLAAYNRLLSGQTALYDMSDTKKQPSIPGDKDGESEDDEEPSPPGNGGGQPSTPSEKEEIGNATVSIRISSSEVPLNLTTTKIFAGETAFDVLKRLTAENGVELNYRQTEYGTYVVGIGGVSEFDRGPLSGWMYRVNGVFPAYSAAAYTLSPNDKVEWLYTKDLGKDIGGYVEDVENTPGQGAGNAGSEKEDNDKAVVIEVNSENENTEVVFTLEEIQTYIENQNKKIIVQNEKGDSLEIPTSSLSAIKEDEKVIASIKKESESKQFTVNFGIESINGDLKPLSTKQEYLKVTLPTFEVKPNTVVLLLVDGEYKSVPHKIVNGEIALFTKTGGTFVVTESTITFNDIAHLANKEEIEFLASRHVILGTTEETFDPYKPITRAQFSALISRALGLQPEGENPFSDTKGKWYAKEVQALYEAGITNGTTASTFNPEAIITRQQAAALMARILERLNIEAQVTAEADFKDAGKIGAEYLPYIELLNSLDIMTGKHDGSFDPGASLTRVQTAKILKRTLTIAGMM